jgi:hypothetical protein
MFIDLILLYPAVFFSKGQEKYIKPYKSSCDLIYNGENEDPGCVDMIAYLIRQKSEQTPPRAKSIV